MEKLLDLTERVILITGGCGAIGRVVGRVLAEHGATVVANDIVPEDEAAQMFANEGASGPHSSQEHPSFPLHLIHRIETTAAIDE